MYGVHLGYTRNPYDWRFMRGTPALVRLVGGLRKPRQPILGADVAGQVETVGRNVTGFRPGDEVFALVPSRGCLAEYVSLPENLLGAKPTNLTFEQAAAVPLAALTALQSLRDHGRIEPGEKVLINGYDLLVDNVGKRRLSDCRRVLNPDGVFILVAGLQPITYWIGVPRMWVKVLSAALVWSQKVVLLPTVKPSQDDLRVMKELIESEKVTPVIDRTHPLSDTPEAIRYLEEGHARGKVVITV